MHMPAFSKGVLRFAVLGTCLLGSLSCAGSSKEATAAEAANNDPNAGSPGWVMGDCRDQFKGKSVLCGVGAVSGVTSPSLARNTAMARGRTEISRYLSVEVKSVLIDYQGSQGGVNEQEIEDRSSQISEMTLNGSRMASYFIAKDGTYYALMVLELEAFTDSVSKASNLDDALKKALIEHANKSFSVLDSEVSRY
jgi:hypothetical protein